MIFGLFLALAFDPFVFQGATTPRWCYLAMALPVMVGLAPVRGITVLHPIGLLLLAWCAASLTWTSNIYDGAGQFIHLIIMALAFVLGARLDSLAEIFKGLALGLTVSSALVAIPHSIPYSIMSTAHEGLMGNRNMLAEATMLVALGCIVYRLWWYLPGLTPALYFAQSRAAMLALIAASLVWLWPRSKTGCIALAALIGTATIAAFGLRLDTAAERIAIWQDTIPGLTWLGHGLGSYYTDFAYTATHWDLAQTRPEHAHNELLETAFELGAVGIVLFAGFFALAYRWASPDHHPLLAALFAMGMVSFPLHVPVTAFLGSLLAGHAVRSGHRLHHRIGNRGVALQPGHDIAMAGQPAH